MKRQLHDNLQRVRERIAAACARAGRDPSSVRLVAVTKTVEVDVIRALLAVGLTDLAESRVQQLAKRAAMIAETLRPKQPLDSGQDVVQPTWHMVGHLQRNKVRAVLQWARVIHSLDSLRVAEQIEAEARQQDTTVEVFLQVNVAGERQKFGAAVGAIDLLVEQVRALPHLRLVGLMTMAPRVGDPQEVRSYFARLADIAADLHQRAIVGGEFCELSMGMSNDFEVAIEEGATVVRIGSALFRDLTGQ